MCPCEWGCARFQQQGRARRKPQQGDLNPARAGLSCQGVPAPTIPGGSSSRAGGWQPPPLSRHKGLGVLSSRDFSLHSGGVRALPFCALPQ